MPTTGQLLTQIKRMAVLLFLTAILAASACVLVALQETRIGNLQRKIDLRETTWQRQLDFDQTVTNKLKETN